MLAKKNVFRISSVFLCLFAVIGIFVASSAHANTNLKFQWRFTEGAGTTASDSSGNTPSYPGTLYNGPTWIPGGGISLDGINDYARTNNPIPGSMGVPDQAYTLSASVRVAEGEEDGNIIHISNGANGVGWCISMLHIKDGRFRAIGWESGFPVIAEAPEPVIPGEWYSIANTWSPETNSLDLYINGALVASSTMSDYDAANEDVYIFAGIGTGMCSNDQGFFKGDVKDVRIYSRAISEEEAQQNSNEVLLGAPYIDSLSPANNATAVTTTADLAMTFSDVVIAATGTIDIYNSVDDSLFESIIVTSSNITGSGTDIITINPSNTLAPSTTYYVYVSDTAFINTSGTPYAGISASSTWRFTTEQERVPPVLEAVTPTNGATSVPIGSNLVLTFDEAVEATSGTIDLYNSVDGALLTSVSVTSSEVTGSGTDTITIDLNTPLFPSTSYYLLFSAGVFEDLAENDHIGILSSSTWRFTTAAPTTNNKITISPISATVAENGGTQLFTIRLSNPIIVPEGRPNTVTMHLMVDDTNQATLSADTVEWNTSTWFEPRYVTTTAVNDTTEGDESAHVYWVVSTDAVFYQGTVGDISLTLIDDDAEEVDEEDDVDEEPNQRGGGYTPPTIPRVGVGSTNLGNKDDDGAYLGGAFRINNGASITDSRAVTLNFTDIEQASHVALSESSDFDGASYQPFAVSLPFTLSDVAGTKTVYAKIRSAEGGTIVLKDSIVLGGIPQTPINPEQGLQCNSRVYLTNAVKFGATNNSVDVRLLEEFLNTYENANLTVNGIYEQADFNAVVRWQEKYSADILTPWGLTKGTGYVFTTSLKKIKEIHDANCATALPAPIAPVTPTACLTTTETLRLGMTTASVSIAQRLLQRLGYFPVDMTVTGYFGSVTETSVRAFQAAEGIAAVGFIGPQTRARLNERGC